MTTPRTPNRDPRAPRLTIELERPAAVEDVFVDEALNKGLRLENIRFAGIETENVELKRFVLTEVDLTGAKASGGMA